MSFSHAPRFSLRLVLSAVAVSMLFAVTVPSSGSAMTIIAAPLSDLVKTSELVLYGTIGKVEVLDMRRQGRGVWTA